MQSASFNPRFRILFTSSVFLHSTDHRMQSIFKLVEYQPSRKSICLSRPGAVVISYLVQLLRDDRSRRLKRKTSIIPTLQGWSVVVGDVTCPTIAVIDVQR
ncbi:hypothetical protein T08_11453 [Trichinella sp. T8]|nr:hypothetical protein T08_11453 [Trichinella sp. T8]